MHQREATKKEEERGQIRDSGKGPRHKRNPGSPPCPVLPGRAGGRGPGCRPQKGGDSAEKVFKSATRLPRSGFGPGGSRALPAEGTLRGVPGHVTEERHVHVERFGSRGPRLFVCWRRPEEQGHTPRGLVRLGVRLPARPPPLGTQTLGKAGWCSGGLRPPRQMWARVTSEPCVHTGTSLASGRAAV